MDPPYLNSKISYSSDLGEDVQYHKNLLKDDHKLYRSMSNNEQYSKVKHVYQFYANYGFSLKHNYAMVKLIF